MPSIKRRADDSLLPLRAPKQRKTTAHHPCGGNSSPAQFESLGSRWLNLGKQFMTVMRDTLIAPFASILSCESFSVTSARIVS